MYTRFHIPFVIVATVSTLRLFQSPVYAGPTLMFHEKFRFFDQRAEPEKLNSMAVSPSGKYVALSTGTRRLSIIDIQKKEIVWSREAWKFHSLAFAPAGNRLIGADRFHGHQLIDWTPSQKRYRSKLPKDLFIGYSGVYMTLKNGRILVARIDKRGPAADSDIKTGDEVVEIRHGRNNKYNKRKWVRLAGRSKQDIHKAMSNPPGTWISFRLERGANGKTVEVEFQRSWQKVTIKGKVYRPSVRDGATLVAYPKNGHIGFRYAENGRYFSFIDLHAISGRGLPAISKDARLFGFVGQRRDNGLWWLEIHTLEDSRLKWNVQIPTQPITDFGFSQDGKKALVATRDSVEVFDTVAGKWIDPLVVTKPEHRDKGRRVRRRVPLGFAGPGALFAPFWTTVYTQPAAVRRIAILKDDVVAIVGDKGKVTLWASRTQKQISELPRSPLTTAPEIAMGGLVTTNSGAQPYLLLYSNGTLYVYYLK